MSEAALCVIGAVVLTSVLFLVTSSEQKSWPVNHVAELKVPGDEVLELRDVAQRFGLPFGELFTLYLMENDFFPEGSNSVEISDDYYQVLERRYIVNYDHIKGQYGEKTIKPYRDMLDSVLTEFKVFPIVEESYIYGDWFSLSRPRNTGIDIYDRENIPGRLTVVSVSDGVVDSAGENRQDGKYIKIRSDSGNIYTYSCLRTVTSSLSPGSRVAAGQEIGRMGAAANGAGLHFGLQAKTGFAGTIWVNPFIFLRLIETNEND